MAEETTVATFIGGPIDGQVWEIKGNPSSYQLVRQSGWSKREIGYVEYRRNEDNRTRYDFVPARRELPR